MHRTGKPAVGALPLVTGLLLGVLVMSGCSYLSGTVDNSPSSSGPLRYQGEGVRQTSGYVGPEDAEFLFGGTWLENTSDQEVELSGATLVGDVDPADAEVVGVRVFRMDEATDEVGAFGIGELPDEQAQRSWQMAHPFQGATVAPGEVVVAYFRVKVHRPVEAEWPAAEVSYSVGDRGYIVEADHALNVCTSSKAECAEDDW